MVIILPKKSGVHIGFAKKILPYCNICHHLLQCGCNKESCSSIENGGGGRMEQEISEHKGQAPKVKSLAKALNVLSCFTTQHPVWGISDLAERIGVTKSNIHNIVSTFCDMGYLERTPDGRYTLGLKMLEFAFIINQNLGYPNAVYDIMVETAGQTDEIVYFGLPYGESVLYLYVAHPTNRIGVLPYRDILGETAPMYCTSLGKAMLSAMPEEEWEAHLPEQRVQYQPNTITDLDAIFEELHRTKRLGYAIDNCEHDVSVRCVGVPVYSARGDLVAGLSTSGPAATMTDEKLMECANILRNAAARMRDRIYR
jgi:IclR family KDG regulon transcriptional repressor